MALYHFKRILHNGMPAYRPCLANVNTIINMHAHIPSNNISAPQALSGSRRVK